VAKRCRILWWLASSIEEEQVPVHRCQHPAADEQVADVDDRTPGLEGAQPVVGERDLAQGEGTQDRWDVGFGEPQDAAAGSAHRAHRVEERNQLGANGTGAVVEYHREPVSKDASPADPGVMEPALDAAPGAGEVAEPARAGGAQRLAVLANTGDQSLYAAAGATAIGLTRPCETARAQVAFGPLTQHHEHPTMSSLLCWGSLFG
jgi:hypothetical protein